MTPDTPTSAGTHTPDPTRAYHCPHPDCCCVVHIAVLVEPRVVHMCVHPPYNHTRTLHICPLPNPICPLNSTSPNPKGSPGMLLCCTLSRAPPAAPLG